MRKLYAKVVERVNPQEDLDQMRKLYAKVVERVNPQEDDVRFYGISEEAVSRVLVIGGSPPQPPPTVYII